MTRKQRGKRIKRPIGIEITKRDREILMLLGLVRYLSTNQIAREFFSSTDRCRRRLRKLFDSRYIKITLLSSNKPNLISLTASGKEIVLRDRPDLENSIQMPGLIKLAGVNHKLMLVETRLYLANLAQAEKGHLLRWESGRGALAEQIGISEYHIVPDALAEVQMGSEVMRLAIEADCGTEGRQTLERKLKQYGKVMVQGQIDELWIVIAGSKARQKEIEKLVCQTGLAEYARVMTVAHLSKRPAQKPVQRAAMKMKDKNPYSASSSFSISSSFHEVGFDCPASVRRAERIG